MVHAVLFDLDFTLCDASGGISHCIRCALSRMGHREPEPDEIRRSIGLSLPETYAFLTGDRDPSRADTFETYFLEEVPGNLTAGTQMFPAVPEVLGFLRRSGIKTGLVTSKYREAVVELLEANRLDALFDCIVCGDDVDEVKPDPAGLQLCCEKLQVTNYLYVGDSPVDFHAVRSHGVGEFIPVLSGATTADVFKGLGVEGALQCVAQLPEVVAQRIWQVQPHEYIRFQHDVEQMILGIGGYWSAPSAVLRVVEELGEFSSVLRAGDTEAIADELTDIFIITLCIANQYAAMLCERGDVLTNSDTLALKGTDALQLLPRFVELAGELARTVNAYDGDKPPKKDERRESVETWVARIHSLLWLGSYMLQIDLRARLVSKLEKAARRDRGRFTAKFDPSTSGAARTLRKLQASTNCPFARRAKVWGAREWDDSKSFAENVRAAADGLTRFARISRFEGLDVFAVVLPDRFGATVEDLATTTHKLLSTLVERDQEQVLQMERIEDPEWQFAFAGERFFITTHASCYPREHSRYAYGCGETVFAFHPEHSFDSPRFNVNGPVLHELVRKLFRDGGQPYDGSAAMRSKLEAAKYVKPVGLDSPIVRWWNTESESDDSTPLKE